MIMKNFARILIFLLGAFLIAVMVIEPGEVFKEYSKTMFALPIIAMAMMLIAPFYPDGGKFYQMVSISQHSSVNAFSFFMIAAVLVMPICFGGILYEHSIGQEIGVRLFASTFAASLIFGGISAGLMGVAFFWAEFTSLRRSIYQISK